MIVRHPITAFPFNSGELGGIENEVGRNSFFLSASNVKRLK